MAAGTPTGAARQVVRVFVTADDDLSGCHLGLHMALEAKDLVPLGEHPLIDGAVGRVAAGAAFAEGFVLEDERTALGRMAFEAGFVRGRHGSPAALHCPSFVGVMAVAAADLALLQGMMMGRVEGAALVEMALVAGLGGLARIDDGAGRAAGLDMDAGRAVA